MHNFSLATPILSWGIITEKRSFLKTKKKKGQGLQWIDWIYIARERNSNSPTKLMPFIRKTWTNPAH